MNNYTLTEIVSAKKKAFKLGLYFTAAQYRDLECKIKGINTVNGVISAFGSKPQGVYIDLRDLRQSCK